MSTPPTAGPHDGERRKSLGKYVKRMGSVFKREKSSKSVSQLSSTAAAPVGSGVEQQQSRAEQTQAPRTEITRDEAATQAVALEPAKAESIKQEDPTEAPAAT